MNPGTEVPFFVAAQQLVKECGVLVGDIERNLAAVFGSLPTAAEGSKPSPALAHEHLQALENLKMRLTQVMCRLDALTGDGAKRDMAEAPAKWR